MESSPSIFPCNTAGEEIVQLGLLCVDALCCFSCASSSILGLFCFWGFSADVSPCDGSSYLEYSMFVPMPILELEFSITKQLFIPGRDDS